MMATANTAETGTDVDLTAARGHAHPPDPDPGLDLEDVAPRRQRDRDPTSSLRTSPLLTFPTPNSLHNNPTSCNRASRQHRRTSASSQSPRLHRPIIKARGRRRHRRLQRAGSRRIGYHPCPISAADGPRRLPYLCRRHPLSNSSMVAAGTSSMDGVGGASIAAKDTGAVGGIEGADGDSDGNSDDVVEDDDRSSEMSNGTQLKANLHFDDVFSRCVYTPAFLPLTFYDHLVARINHRHRLSTITSIYIHM